MGCKGCDYRKNSKDGICMIEKGSDGLSVRCVGPWSKDKYFYLKRYFEVFTTSMKNKWKLCYIDLFAGCGKCRIRETGEEIDGSALISLSIKNTFAKYIFVELEQGAVDVLYNRMKKSLYQDRVSIIQGDCNEKIDEIINEIPKGSLCLVVIDPTGLHIKFDTLRELTKNRRVDLVITFPEGMDIKRNLLKYMKQSHSILDDFVGDKDWRLLFSHDVKDLDKLSSFKIEHSLIGYYRKKLNSLGYKEIKSGDEILIRSSQKNLPLYYLLFASKHPLGHEFWRAISKISPSGQMKLPLNNGSSGYIKENSAPYMPVKPKVKYKEYKLLNGKTETLVEKVNDGSIITRFDKTLFPERPTDAVCPHFLELKWAYGCPYDCSWCYLKGTFRFRPNGKEPAIKDLDKIMLHTRTFLEDAETPEILNTGELADSLMSENGGRPFSKFIVPLFESQNKHKVLFLTKSSNVDNLLELEPHKQVIVSFSLNAIPVADRWEKAPSIIRRIEAAQKLYNARYEVRVRIDPMVPIEDCEKHYLYLVDLIFERFIPERITLGSLRGLQSTINGCSDKSWTEYLSESSSWGKKIDIKLRYQMYASIIRFLQQKYRYEQVALCKETIQMWDMLGMNYKKLKCNCAW